MPQQFEMLSFGVFAIIVALTLVAYSATILNAGQIFPVIIAFYGIWTIVLAGIRTQNPEKYGRGAYSTMVMGVILLAIGGAWFLLTTGMDPILTMALLLVVVGILAVASAIPSMRKK
jgi:prolipoprotein diacylglyceryltransferase